MIHLAVSTRRSFYFPAPFVDACAYYHNWPRLLALLPQLQIVQTFGPNEYRLAYQRNEMAGYTVTLYCDVRVEFDEASTTLYVRPLKKHPPVPGKATRHGLTGQGSYASTFTLQDAGDKTYVKYHMAMEAELVKPVRLKWVPNGIVERIIKGRVEARMQEMDAEFIARLLADYQKG